MLTQIEDRVFQIELAGETHGIEFREATRPDGTRLAYTVCHSFRVQLEKTPEVYFDGNIYLEGAELDRANAGEVISMTGRTLGTESTYRVLHWSDIPRFAPAPKARR